MGSTRNSLANQYYADFAADFLNSIPSPPKIGCFSLHQSNISIKELPCYIFPKAPKIFQASVGLAVATGTRHGSHEKFKIGNKTAGCQGKSLALVSAKSFRTGQGSHDNLLKCNHVADLVTLLPSCHFSASVKTAPLSRCDEYQDSPILRSPFPPADVFYAIVLYDMPRLSHIISQPNFTIIGTPASQENCQPLGALLTRFELLRDYD